MPHHPGDVLKPLVKIDRDPAKCWTWLGKVDDNGFAIKQWHGKPIPAARWMWMQLFGPIPDGLVVNRTCGNRACTNPHHLRATFQADAIRSGMQPVLTPADVAEIRAAKRDRGPNTARLLADRLGCHENTIRDVWRGRTYTRTRAKFYGAATKRRLAEQGKGDMA